MRLVLRGDDVQLERRVAIGPDQVKQGAQSVS